MEVGSKESREGYVGEILEMGLQTEIQGGGVNLSKPKVNHSKPLRNRSQSMVMMIYYCQITSGSFRAQWELQESSLNAHSDSAWRRSR